MKRSLNMLNRGDLLYESQPYVYSLSNSSRCIFCSSCFKRCESLKTCTKCKVLQYCGTKCQREDWSVHKEECKCLQNVSPDIPVDSVMLILRLIINYQKNYFGKADQYWGEFRSSFKDFKSHKEEIEKDGERMNQFSQILFTLKKILQNQLPAVGEIFDIFCKMTINSFTICDGELNPIGVGIYISPSLIDHSCEPNAVVTFSGKTLQIRALQPISDPEPSNIRISYIDQLEMPEKRQEQLCRQYYFTCICSRCISADQRNTMKSIGCQKCSPGLIKPKETYHDYQPCDKCNYQVNEELMNQTHKYHTDVYTALECLKQDKKEKEADYVLQKCVECQKEFSKFFSNFNIYCVQILDIGLDACIDCGNWDQALVYTSQLIPPYRLYYPPYSPQIGLLLMKQGKIHLYIRKTKEALVCLQQAEEVIKVTHGREHTLYKDLETLIDQCMEEMRVMLEQT